jgi:hypothetical protein
VFLGAIKTARRGHESERPWSAFRGRKSEAVRKIIKAVRLFAEAVSVLVEALRLESACLGREIDYKSRESVCRSSILQKVSWG